ncbi:MAG: PD-(D/E)XK nuclease family protein [Candidatus Humimicrobiia bacterium]
MMINKLSYSAISTYLNCPLQYKLVYIDGLKLLPKPYFSFGNSLHKLVAYFFKDMFLKPPALDDFLKYYKDNWLSEGYETKENEKEHFLLGENILREFYNLNKKDYKKPISVEYYFKVDFNNIILTGLIDRVDKLPSGNLEIIDYKSGKVIPTIYDLNEDLQLSIYHIAAEETWNILPEKLTIYHLRSNTSLSTKRGIKQLDKAKELIFKVLEEIKKGNFKPKIGRFCPCDFPQHCPHFSKEIKEENIKREDNNKIFKKPKKISKEKVMLINELWQLMLKKGYNKEDAKFYITFNFGKEKGIELTLEELKSAIEEFKDGKDNFKRVYD